MIYEFPDESKPIEQGDIFVNVPRLDLSLNQLVIAGDDDQIESSWRDVMQRPNVADQGEAVTAIIAIRPVAAIVISQNCDVSRAQDISLCEIRTFRDVERKSQNTASSKSWVSILTQQARLNQKWFYLPPDERVGFKDKMGVDFLVTLRLPRPDLENYRYLRRARLNGVAYEHFRERLGDFFRRYAYDEWYPLSIEEMDEYAKQYPEAERFTWQVRASEGEKS